MALSVSNLSSYPSMSFGVTLTQVNAPTYTFTNGVFTAGTVFVAGYLDGENRSKLFFTDGSTIPLPKMLNIKQVSQVDAAGTTKTGFYFLTLTAWSALSPDASSINSEIFLDADALL